MGGLIACLCEGTAEEAIINLLLTNDKLNFTRENLLENDVIRCRSAKNFQDRHLRKGFKEKITVYRILDSRKENFKLDAAYRTKVKVIDIITAPEIEMLIIIHEGKYKQYTNSYSNMKPSSFCKEVLALKSIKSKEFIYSYFNDIDKLVASIKEYKRIKNIPDGEKCLADLLK